VRIVENEKGRGEAGLSFERKKGRRRGEASLKDHRTEEKAICMFSSPKEG